MKIQMRTTPALGMFVVLVCLQTAAAGQEAVPSAFALPPWRIQVLAYGEDTGPTAAVYHRLGERWDLGLIVSADVSDRNAETDRYDIGEDDTERDETQSSFGLEPEIRRWTSRGSALATFIGARAGVRFGERTSEMTTFVEGGGWHATTNDSDWTEMRIGLSFGADVQLLQHLSVLFAVVPVNVTYRWEETRSSFEMSQQSPDPIETQKAERLTAGFHVVPGLYATVSF